MNEKKKIRILWKHKRTTKIFFAIGVILLAVVLILSDIGIIPGVGEYLSVWEILLSVVLIFCMGQGLIEGSPWQTMIPLTVLFCTFQDELAQLVGYREEKFVSTGVVILAALLVAIGWSGLRGQWKKKSSGRFGDAAVYVDAKDLGTYRVDNKLGSYDLFVENPEAYAGDGTIEVDNKLGSVTIHIPRDWSVLVEMDNKLGSVDLRGGNGNGPRLTVSGENKLGEVEIVRLKN